ncbi:hypothetical protein HMPREF1508_0478 [Shuttleworthella sp. MSX8B]|nr:hypothetical protein HMPREF1508_0478 [Shuttleworthia sp. MSX8B]
MKDDRAHGVHKAHEMSTDKSIINDLVVNYLSNKMNKGSVIIRIY